MATTNYFAALIVESYWVPSGVRWWNSRTDAVGARDHLQDCGSHCNTNTQPLLPFVLQPKICKTIIDGTETRLNAKGFCSDALFLLSMGCQQNYIFRKECVTINHALYVAQIEYFLTSRCLNIMYIIYVCVYLSAYTQR